MKLFAPITAITLVVLVPMYIRLAFGVIRKRRQHRIAVGSGNNADLEAAIRAHGNFSEYVPFALILILAAEINGTPIWLSALVAALLVSGRLIHAAAIPAGDLAKRVQAMKLTFASLVLGAIANIVPLVTSLLTDLGALG